MPVTITVEGMSCDGCESTVVDALEAVDGVVEATADRATDSASVEGEADVGDLIHAVTEAGYTARV